MAALKVALCLALCAGAAASGSATLRSKSHAASFVRSLEFKRRLRVCNAYPFAAELNVFLGSSEQLTKDAPLAYKDCSEFAPKLQEGDKLEFKIGDASAGTFSVGELPANDAVLLLVIHRHDTLSTAVSFESHMYSNLASAQVAVLDAYRGKARSTPKIVEFGASPSNITSSEDLRYDSVIAVNKGIYDVVLQGEDGQTKAKSELVALDKESYVILRTGVEAQMGAAYPQELVIYPKSDKKLIHSGAAAVSVAPLAVLAAALVLARA